MSFDSKDCAFCTFDKGMIGDCLQSKNPVITQKHIDAAQKILDWVNVAVEYFQGKIEDGEM
jgi:hypothetical protein